MKKSTTLSVFFCSLIWCAISFAQSSIKWTSIAPVGEKTQKTIELWKKEVLQSPLSANQSLPELTMLIKTGEDGVFLDEEIDKWASDSDVQWARQRGWSPNRHSALVLWKNKKSVGCLVHLPSESSWERAKEVFTYEWMIWHELSHCVWPYRQTKLMWWEKMRVLGSEKLAELQEETWADVWALALSKKHLGFTKEQVSEVLLKRSRDALVFEDMGHWSNVGIWWAWTKYEPSGDLRKQITQWVDESTLDEDDVDWAYAKWSGSRSVKPKHPFLVREWNSISGTDSVKPTEKK
jgi:hypothetical protein